MSKLKIVERECPICGHKYIDVPAISRLDNVTMICPECGTRQALESIGVVDPKEQDHIIQLAHKTRRGNS